MRSLVIILFLAVVSSAPSGVEHGIAGPTTAAPFAGTHTGGFYGGHSTSAQGQFSPLSTSHNNGYASQSGGLQTKVTSSRASREGYFYGAPNNGGYFGGSPGYYGGGATGSYGNGGYYNGGNGAILSTAGNSFGNTHASLPIGNPGPFLGLNNGHSTAGANNNGFGGFSGAPIDGHIHAGSPLNFNNGLNNGFDGHLTPGVGINTAASGSFTGPNLGHAVGPLLPEGAIDAPGIGPFGPANGGHFEQGPIVTKDFYLHTAADDYDEDVVSKTINLGPSRKHYHVVFIKAPSTSAKAAALQILQAQNEEKTVIYVLNKKNDAAEIHTEIQAQKKTHSKPEVFFLKYKTPEEAIHAQKHIQAQYDSLGGESHFADEVVSPVTSIVGSVGQTGPGSIGGHGVAAEGPHSAGIAGAGSENFGGAFINDASASTVTAASHHHHP